MDAKAESGMAVLFSINDNPVDAVLLVLIFSAQARWAARQLNLPARADVR